METGSRLGTREAEESQMRLGASLFLGEEERNRETLTSEGSLKSVNARKRNVLFKESRYFLEIVCLQTSKFFH